MTDAVRKKRPKGAWVIVRRENRPTCMSRVYRSFPHIPFGLTVHRNIPSDLKMLRLDADVLLHLFAISDVHTILALSQASPSSYQSLSMLQKYLIFIPPGQQIPLGNL